MKAKFVNEYLGKNNILFPQILDEAKQLFLKNNKVLGPSIEYISNNKYLIKGESFKEYTDLNELLKSIVDVQKHDTNVEWYIRKGDFLNTPIIYFTSKEQYEFGKKMTDFYDEYEYQGD